MMAGNVRDGILSRRGKKITGWGQEYAEAASSFIYCLSSICLRQRDVHGVQDVTNGQGNDQAQQQSEADQMDVTFAPGIHRPAAESFHDKKRRPAPVKGR